MPTTKKTSTRLGQAPGEVATKLQRSASPRTPGLPAPKPASNHPAREPEGVAKIPYIVGVGASAGGLEAVSALLTHLPVDTGMAFVVVSHLDRTEESLLAELLGRITRMPVIEASHRAQVAPDHVYVIPRNTTMILAGGRLELEPRPTRTQHMPVDSFLRSLAFDRRSKAIGVVLSGNGSDGALGLEAIKAEGGLTFAQDVRSAKFDGMPLAALGTGCVDFSMPPDQMANEIGALARALRSAYRKGGEAATALERDDDFARILALIRAAHDVDFTSYRHSTIKRRILRRMVLLKIEQVKEYVQFLKERPAELEALYQDILIKVTHFFRDLPSFEELSTQIVPALLTARGPDQPIRAWVPGCSTGEEAYSIAITLIEALGEVGDVPIQIFATDVSEAALERARAGVYLESIGLDVSAERLRRHFTRSGKYYQVNKAIRDLCVFARQDVTHDPPFSRLDLISCRNVMIYLEPVLQKRVIPVFHYALRPNGYLMLGSSETVGGFSDLFTLVGKTAKVYARTSQSSPLGVAFQGAASPGASRERSERPASKAVDGASSVDVQREADRLVISRYAPAGVIVDGDLKIVQFRGHTGGYLEPAPGEASLNVLKMAREGLLIELRAAIHKARREGAPVRTEGVRIRADGHPREIAIEVIPLREVPREGDGGSDRWLLILFDDAGAPSATAAHITQAARGKARAKPHEARQMEELEGELASTKEYLQAIIEEQEATNEELQSANEELLSSNEELQSINEEIETAKEELQSSNEELTTLNEELESRNGQLSRVNNDLGNLLASVNIPIVMVSHDLRIRRFTPQAERLLNLIQGDVGRKLSDINPNIELPELERLLGEVIDTATIREREVQDRDGRWYSMRIRPYRTPESQIDGAVLCLVDIDALKTLAKQADEKT